MLANPGFARWRVPDAPELTVAWDRRFESGFLQQGVKCELDFPG
jgi:hypothetical protein